MSDKLETNKLLLGERKTESTKTKNVFDKSQVRQIQPFNFINIVLFIHYFRIFFPYTVVNYMNEGLLTTQGSLAFSTGQ